MRKGWKKRHKRTENKWATASKRERKKESKTEWQIERSLKEQQWKRESEKTPEIRDNQAWGSCAKFTAVIWNPTALASGWRGRHNRFSFARNSPCLVGVSVNASLSLLLSVSGSFSVSGVLLHPARCTNETCVTRQAAYLHYTWAASLEDTTPWGIISIVEGKKENVNW